MALGDIFMAYHIGCLVGFYCTSCSAADALIVEPSTRPCSVVAIVPIGRIDKWFADGWRAQRSTIYTVTFAKQFDDAPAAWKAAKRLKGVVWYLEPGP